LPATPCIFSTPFGERLVGAEDGGVGLHGLLHLEPQLGRRRAPIGVADVVEAVDRLLDRRARHVGFAASGRPLRPP
jgi:hypothetical protein